MACLVFAVVGLALGLTVARDGKLAGFVVGIARDLRLLHRDVPGRVADQGLLPGTSGADLSARWVPNIVLGLFGIVALIWRARYAEGRLPFRLPQFVGRLLERIGRSHRRRAPTPPAAAPGEPRPRAAPAGRRWWSSDSRTSALPRPGLIDRYISRIYLRIVGALVPGAARPLLHLDVHRQVRQDVQGAGDHRHGRQLLVYMTPQFVYFVIPIAALLSVLVTFGLLSRSSELTVMKACGISLYRAALLGHPAVARLERRPVRPRAAGPGAGQPAGPRCSTPRSAAGRRGLFERLEPALGDRPRRGHLSLHVLQPARSNELSALAIYRPAARRGARQPDLRRQGAYYAAVAGDSRAGMQDFRRQAAAGRPFPERALPLEPPDYFETEQPVAEMMTVQLRRYVNELSASGFNVGPSAVELQHKLAFPFVTFVMTLLAVPFGVSTGRRGTLYGRPRHRHRAVLLDRHERVRRHRQRRPAHARLAGWAPNILVLGASGYLFLTVQT